MEKSDDRIRLEWLQRGQEIAKLGRRIHKARLANRRLQFELADVMVRANKAVNDMRYQVSEEREELARVELERQRLRERQSRAVDSEESTLL